LEVEAATGFCSVMKADEAHFLVKLSAIRMPLPDHGVYADARIDGLGEGKSGDKCAGAVWWKRLPNTAWNSRI